MDLEIGQGGDLGFRGGRLRTITSPGELVAQRLSLVLQIQRGEWFLDNTLGTPYLDQIFGKAPSLSALSAIFKLIIVGVEGVDDLLSFSLSLSPARVLSLSFSVAVGVETVEVVGAISTSEIVDAQPFIFSVI
tara:strand:+ start:707 stop:1105 length:399 start_codon:yes stop_codon:yes gene_type:complete